MHVRTPRCMSEVPPLLEKHPLSKKATLHVRSTPSARKAPPLKKSHVSHQKYPSARKAPPLKKGYVRKAPPLKKGYVACQKYPLCPKSTPSQKKSCFTSEVPLCSKSTPSEVILAVSTSHIFAHSLYHNKLFQEITPVLSIIQSNVRNLVPGMNLINRKQIVIIFCHVLY